MKKILVTILIIILLLLLARFGATLVSVILHIGIYLLKIAVRFWYIWIAIVIYFMLRDDSDKTKKKSGKDVEDADFTIVEDDDSEETKKRD